MKSATFTNNGIKIKATALNSAGMGFLSGLQNSGQYTEEEAIEFCFEKDGDLISVEELQIKEKGMKAAVKKVYSDGYGNINTKSGKGKIMVGFGVIINNRVTEYFSLKYIAEREATYYNNL